jgi:hypothetical protein
MLSIVPNLNTSKQIADIFASLLDVNVKQSKLLDS